MANRNHSGTPTSSESAKGSPPRSAIRQRRRAVPGPSPSRWVVERTISRLLRLKRLGLRYDRTGRTTLPLLTSAYPIINVRRLITNPVLRPRGGYVRCDVSLTSASKGSTGDSRPRAHLRQ
jgi:hypothetical protein